METMKDILEKGQFAVEDLVQMLEAEGQDRQLLFETAAMRKQQVVGRKVYFRGLVEFSNVCSKDCFYCGIRKSNSLVERYDLSDAEITDACRLAWENGFGSVVLQSGELSSPAFVKRVSNLLRTVRKMSSGELGVTLSCGEQSYDTYCRWFDSGAHRYLLRIESSVPALYAKIHPANGHHRFEKRLACLHDLRRCGYQVGTGVMIGLPFQTAEDLAKDLLFFRQIDVDMIGMGPYLEHEDTPLYQDRHLLKPKESRFDLSLKMIASLRLLMPDINIAASTALQAIDPVGREKALKVGANVMMPNLTPAGYRKDYLLYENKPCIDEDAIACRNCQEARVLLAGSEIGYKEWGDSLHFFKRKSS